MSRWLAWLIRGLTMLLGSCYPAISPERAEGPEWGKDPSYAIYQEYRYTYDTYVYLFWDESTGAGPEDAGTMNLGGQGPVGGAWNQLGNYADAADGSGDGIQGGSGEEGSYPQAGETVAMAGGKTAGDALGETGTKGQEGAGKGSIPAMSQLQDYDFLMKHFYNVHASTTAPRELMKADVLLGMDLRLEKDGSAPQILIYHTHSQERYADYGPGNPGATVVEAGNYLTQLLQAKGWQVIHDTSTYDMQGGKLDRNRAYNYALEGVTRILQENPTIQVVLDLHRDGVKEGLHLVSEVNGKPTANIMFFQGMSRTPEGLIEYLPNPNIGGNLAFSLQMQLKAAEAYPGFTRKIYMKGLRYNLHLRPRSALVEVGAQTNSGQEAFNAMEPLAEILDGVLQGGG